MELNIHRGDVFYIQGPSYCVGSEMSKTRPAVVVSNEKNNIYAPLVEIVYLTTAEKKPLPTHVPITIYGRKIPSSVNPSTQSPKNGLEAISARSTPTKWRS